MYRATTFYLIVAIEVDSLSFLMYQLAERVFTTRSLLILIVGIFPFLL